LKVQWERGNHQPTEADIKADPLYGEFQTLDATLALSQQHIPKEGQITPELIGFCPQLPGRQSGDAGQKSESYSSAARFSCVGGCW